MFTTVLGVFYKQLLDVYLLPDYGPVRSETGWSLLF
jgi:hypothetical protein